MLTAGGQEHVALRELVENELAIYTDECGDVFRLLDPMSF